MGGKLMIYAVLRGFMDIIDNKIAINRMLISKIMAHLLLIYHVFIKNRCHFVLSAQKEKPSISTQT